MDPNVLKRLTVKPTTVPIPLLNRLEVRRSPTPARVVAGGPEIKARKTAPP